MRRVSNRLFFNVGDFKGPATFEVRRTAQYAMPVTEFMVGSGLAGSAATGILNIAPGLER